MLSILSLLNSLPLSRNIKPFVLSRCCCILKCPLWTRHRLHLARQPGLHRCWVQSNIMQIWLWHNWLWPSWGCWCPL